MSEEIIIPKNGKGLFIKKTHFILTLIIVSIVVLSSVISPFVWKAIIDLKVEQNAKEIIRLDKKVEKTIIDSNKKIDFIYKWMLNANISNK